MRYLCTFLIAICSFSLHAKLKTEKIAEAVIQARISKPMKDSFFCSLIDPSVTVILDVRKVIPKQKEWLYCHNLKGIPPGTQFDIYQFNVLELNNPSLLYSGYIDENGEALVNSPGLGEGFPLKKMGFSVNSLLPGEPIYSLAHLKNSDTCLAAYVIPNPIETHGKDGRRVSLEILSQDIYVIVGDNFKPLEKITVATAEKTDMIANSLTVNDKGAFVAVREGNCLKIRKQRAIVRTEELDLIKIQYKKPA